MRAFFAILAGVFLGSGTAQLAERTEALVEGATPGGLRPPQT